MPSVGLATGGVRASQWDPFLPSLTKHLVLSGLVISFSPFHGADQLPLSNRRWHAGSHTSEIGASDSLCRLPVVWLLPVASRHFSDRAPQGAQSSWRMMATAWPACALAES